MCGRFTLTTTDPAGLALRFGGTGSEPITGLLGRYNAAPGQEILIVRERGDGTRELGAARWGLVPAWAEDLKTGYRMINARSETVFEKRAYGPLVRSARTRCLIPADGFFEWTGPREAGGPKRPVRFTVDDGEPFAMAGLVTERDWEGERLVSCTILTTAANEVVAPVHDRMPVILPDATSESDWLGASIDPEDAPSQLEHLLAPLDSGRLSSRMASTALNRVGSAPEGPELLDP